MTRIPLFAVVILAFLLHHDLPSGIKIIDDLGRTVTLASPAQRIISLAPSITESLFAIGAGDQVVAVTDYCSYPPEARRKRSVGGMTNPNMETIAALNPDLLLLSMEGNLREDYQQLLHLDVPLFVTNPRTLRDIPRSLRQLGILTGHTDEAARLAMDLARKEDSLRARARGPRTRTILIVSTQPLIVVGNKTFLNDLLEAAGAENLAAELPSTYPTYSRETLAAQNPEVIIVLSDALDDPDRISSLFPEWSALTAKRNGRICFIDPDLVSRPGPRAVEGLQALVHLLQGDHP